MAVEVCYFQRYRPTWFDWRTLFLQKNVTKRPRATVFNIDENWKRHLNSLKIHSATNLIFEFGAGNDLAQNIFLSSTVTRQIVVDLNPMLDIELVEFARRLLSVHNSLKSDQPIKTIKDLYSYGIEYRAPFDASCTNFADASIDACISTNTLEHIPKINIIKIFNELHRILKTEGIISVKIDYSDHYAHTDPSISSLNYLKYSDKEWRKYNHNCHYQNRLRHYDYLEIFHSCGFVALEEEIIYAEVNIPDLISRQFIDKPQTWSATSAYILLKKN